MLIQSTNYLNVHVHILSTFLSFILGCIFLVSILNPIHDGGRAKRLPLTSFSPVTSTNVRISPKNFMTLSCNPNLNLNQGHPLRKVGFLVKSL